MVVAAVASLVAVAVVFAVVFVWWMPRPSTSTGESPRNAGDPASGRSVASEDVSGVADLTTSGHEALNRSGVPQPDAGIVGRKAGEARMADAKTAIATAMSASGGTWSAYAEDLASGATVSLNEQPMVAASEIKLYVMLTVYDRLASGTLNAGDRNTDALLGEMITVSSNSATNQLVLMIGDGDMAVGMQRVTDTAARYGFASSRQLRALSDAGTDGSGTENWTSSVDCGRLLAALYRGQLVSPEASQSMLTLLEGQTRRNKIPSGVPAGIQVANKTGELGGVENDAAIIWGKAADGSARDYVLVIMTFGVDSATAQQAIVGASSAVYAAMTA